MHCQAVLPTLHSSRQVGGLSYLILIELHAVDKLHAKRKMPGMIQRPVDSEMTFRRCETTGLGRGRRVGFCLRLRRQLGFSDDNDDVGGAHGFGR
ncbi:hypothetical protein KC359_g123 [Hortaea werneckii]|nr:hypothetical protein KC359_g123 [Hortaea werneckii]